MWVKQWKWKWTLTLLSHVHIQPKELVKLNFTCIFSSRVNRCQVVGILLWVTNYAYILCIGTYRGTETEADDTFVYYDFPSSTLFRTHTTVILTHTRNSFVQEMLYYERKWVPEAQFQIPEKYRIQIWIQEKLHNNARDRIPPRL
jgi:hypothetical protein